MLWCQVYFLCCRMVRFFHISNLFIYFFLFFLQQTQHYFKSVEYYWSKKNFSKCGRQFRATFGAKQMNKLSQVVLQTTPKAMTTGFWWTFWKIKLAVKKLPVFSANFCKYVIEFLQQEVQGPSQSNFSFGTKKLIREIDRCARISSRTKCILSGLRHSYIIFCNLR